MVNTVNVWIRSDQNPNYFEIQMEGNSDFRQIFGHLYQMRPVRIDLKLQTAFGLGFSSSDCLGMELKPAVWTPNQFDIQTFTVF